MTDPVSRLTAALADRYRIERELGQGGMATVYLAEDLKHDRKVAIKVLKPELASVIGGERFITEIKTTAALQHPHILPLFDSGEADGFLYYVMPYIQGETLRDLLNRDKQLGVEEALDLTRAVADALDYAHRNGVIHRDIKPANILLHDGRPVVADFGIAVALSAAGGGRMTETGLSLGTPHYMSPEQATADRDLTPRSDIYSLACVLYEMLSGDPPHTASTAQAVLIRILTEPPRPVRQVRSSVPEHVSAVLEKALEKLPADRFSSASEFMRALEDEGFRWKAKRVMVSTPENTDGGSRGSHVRSQVAAAVAVALIVAAYAIGFATGGDAPMPEAEASWLPTIRVPLDSVAFPAGLGTGAALSPDGSMVAGFDAASSSIEIIDLNGVSRQSIPLEESPNLLVFSPDSRELLLGGAGELRRVSVDGGSPITVARTPGAIAIPYSWEPDGTMYFGDLAGTYRVREGQDPERVLTSGWFYQRWVRPLPGGRTLLFTEQLIDAEYAEIRLLDMDTGETSTLVQGGFDGRYLPSGHLLYGRTDQSLVAVPFDPEAGAITGPARVVLDSIGINQQVGAVSLGVSANGIAVYQQGDLQVDATQSDQTVVLVGRDGSRTSTRVPAGRIDQVDISPDGRTLAASSQSGEERLRLIDLVTGSTRPVEGVAPLTPVFSRDGSRLAYGTLSGTDRIYETRVVHLDSLDRPVTWTTDASLMSYPTSWTVNDEAVVVSEMSDVSSGTPNPDIAIWNPDSDERTPYLDASWVESEGRVSPDGRWIVYISNEDGGFRVFIRSFPEPGEATWVGDLTQNGTARWSRAGDEVFYATGDSLWSASVSLDGGQPRVTQRRPLFALESDQGRLDPGGFAVHPDGRLVMIQNPPEPEKEEGDGEVVPSRTYLVVNWFRELRALVDEGS